MLTLAIVFGVIGLMVLWYINGVARSTDYKAIQPGDGQVRDEKALRDESRNRRLRKIYIVLAVYIGLCLSSYGIVAAAPAISKVRDALYPSSTPTVTATPTPTATRTITPTPRNSPTPRATFTQHISPTPSLTATPKVIYYHTVVVQTQIVQVTRIVVRTVEVQVYWTFVVTATPLVDVATTTETPTIAVAPTETATITETPSP